jgi:two-component system cell cycle sensor histidine kinase/response regulator CckA
MAATTRLLLVEDDAVTRRSLCRALRDGDPTMSVQEAASARDAMAALLAGNFDCVILDYLLPDGDGLSILRSARAAGSRIPVIILTAAGDEQLAVEVMKAGATDYLSKNRLSPEALVQSVRYAMRVHEAECRAAEAHRRLIENQQRLQHSESRLRRLYDTNMVGIFYWRIDGAITEANDEFLRTVGYSRDDLAAGRVNWVAMTPPEFTQTDAAMTRMLRATGRCGPFEKQYLRGDGRRISVMVGAAFLEGSDSEGIAFVLDISQRQRAEDRLREAEQRYRTLFELSPFGVMVIDPDSGAFVDFNTAAHRQLGYSREEFAALSLDRIEADAATPTAQRIQRTLRLGADEYETRHRTAGGALRDVLVSARRLEIGSKTFLHAIVQDITERNRLREQLLHSQKMEAIGRLAGGVAHDFNNVLAVISGYSESLARRLAPDDPLRVHAEEILQAAHRGGELTRQLLDFSRRQPVQPRDVDLNQTLHGLSAMLRRVTSQSIRIEMRTDPQLRPVRGDPTQLEQVIMNLALNARDAMPRGGTLSFLTRGIRLSGQSAALAGVQDGEYSLLMVSDTGVGMDDVTRARVFEPFFTTKGSQGSGLGLSIAYSIVRDWGGNILVQSRPGRGTVFEVLLPVAGAPSSNDAQSTTESETPNPNP